MVQIHHVFPLFPTMPLFCPKNATEVKRGILGTKRYVLGRVFLYFFAYQPLASAMPNPCTQMCISVRISCVYIWYRLWIYLVYSQGILCVLIWIGHGFFVGRFCIWNSVSADAYSRVLMNSVFRSLPFRYVLTNLPSVNSEYITE